MGAVGGVAILGGNFEASTFPEDKVVQRSLTAGTQESSPIDAIILDALPLGAPGQLDSHATVWKGHSNDGSPHTIDWKLFVDVTADDGTGSLWTLQTRIDAAPYGTVLTIDDNGLLTVSGATFTMDQLIIDSDNAEAVLIRKDGDAGDVFIVDTVNDVVRLGSNDTFLTFGASSDARLERFGPRDIGMREPGVGGVSLGAGGENTFRIYARDDVAGSAARFLELTGDGPTAVVKANRFAGGGQFDLFIDVTVGRIAFFNENVQRWNIQGSVTADFEFAPFITNRYDLGSASFAVRNLYTNGVLIGQDKTSAYDAITIDGTDLAAPGQQDSGAIILTGLSNDGSPHDIDWKQFVNVTSNAGASEFRLETRIDGAGFADKFVVEDDGGFDFPDAGFDVKGSPTTGSRALLTQFDVTGTGVGQVTAVQFDNFVLGIFGDTDQLSTFRITSAIETPAALTTDTVSQMVINEPETSIGAGGSVTNESVIFIDRMPVAGDNTYGLRILSNRNDQGGNATAAIFIGASGFFGGPGQLDSDAIFQRGHSNDGTGHAADWKFFVDLTANDGTSAWVLQHQLDGGGFATKLTIDDAGNLTIPGSFTVDGLIIDVTSTEAFLVRKDGDTEDVFIVDTTNEAVRLSSDDTFLAFGASSDAQIHRGDGADIIEQRRGANPQKWNIYDNFVSNSDYDRLSIYVGGGPPIKTAEIVAESTDATQGINIIIESKANAFGEGSLTLLAGTSGAQLALQPSSAGSTAFFTGGGRVDFSNDIRLSGLIASLGLTETVPGVGLFMTIASVAAPGFRNSHSIDLQGVGGGAARATWRTFVEILNIGADSIYTLQLDDGGGFDDVLTIGSAPAGVLTLPQVASALAVGTIPASAGAIRLSTQAAIEWRNAGDTNNLTVLTTDGSDVLFFGDNVVASIRVEPLIGGVVSTSWAGLNEAASGTNPTLIPNRAGTNTGIGATDNQALDIIVNSVSRMHFSATLIEVTNPLQGAATGAYALLNEEASNTNPTLIPDKRDLTTGIGARDPGPGGYQLNLVVQGKNVVQIDGFSANFVTMNAATLDVNGQIIADGIEDVVQLTAQGHSTQTANIFIVETNAGVDLFTVNNDGGFNSPLPLASHAIGGSILDFVQVLISGNFTSGGGSDHAAKFKVEGTLLGAIGDTDHLSGVYINPSITTQAEASGTGIEDISSLRIDEPDITDNLILSMGSGGIASAQTLLISGSPTEGKVGGFNDSRNFTLRATGPAPTLFEGPQFAIGVVTVLSHNQVLVGGTFTSGGFSNHAAKFRVEGTLIGAIGDTVHLSAVYIGPGPFIGDFSIDTQTATENIDDISSLRIDEPNITDNLTGGGLITNAQSLLITGAPTEGVSNFAFRIISGEAFLGGDLSVAGDSANGQFTTTTTVSALVSTPSGSTATAVGLIPAGSFVIGITVRVTTTVTGPSGFDVGDGIDVDRWGNSIAVASGTTTDITDYTSGAVTTFPVANDVVITSDGVDFTGGAVRITVHYQTLNPATS